jgi:hypothetical protein
MDHTTYTKVITEYEGLVDRFHTLSAKKDKLSEDYRSLNQILGAISVSRVYSQLEQDLNRLVAQYAQYNTPLSLKSELDEYIGLLALVDRDAQLLEQKCEVYKNVPKRNGWQVTVSKVKALLDMLPSLPLSQLRRVAQDLLPQALEAISKVEGDISGEVNHLRRLRAVADDLENKLVPHKQTIDMHNFYAVRQMVEKAIAHIRQSPHMDNLTQEEKELEQCKRDLEHCLFLFKQDHLEILDFEIDKREVWLEDVEDLVNFRDSIDVYTSTIRIKDLELKRSKATAQKKGDIDQALKAFKSETLKRHSKPISDLRMGVYSRADLSTLVENLHKFEREAELALYKQIAKWTSIALLVGAGLYGLYWVITMHPYILAVVLILLLIGIVKMFLD